MYLNSVQQMVSGELAGEGLQTGFSRHGLPPQRALLDTVYLLREHLNSVQGMVSGGYCEGLFPDTVCWTRLRNTWSMVLRNSHICICALNSCFRSQYTKECACIFSCWDGNSFVSEGTYCEASAACITLTVPSRHNVNSRFSESWPREVRPDGLGCRM